MRNEELGIRNEELGIRNEKCLVNIPHSSFLTLHSYRVLVAPLNWGLGHATRWVPIIRELLRQGKEVVIAAEGYPLRFLRREFPHLEWVEFEGLKVEYADSESQVGAMLRQLPGFLRGIWREHRELKRIVEAYDIQVVISDNRFGLWCGDVYSVYMTHQLMVKMPRGLRWMECGVWRLHRWFIRHYDECWVPDVEGEDNLSGDLSHKYPLLKNTKFIGVLSRFSAEKVEWEDVRVEAEALDLDERYDVVAVLSGPEPHRSNLEAEIASMHNAQPTVLSNSEKCTMHNLTPSASLVPLRQGDNSEAAEVACKEEGENIGKLLTPSALRARPPKTGGQYGVLNSKLLIVQGLPADDLRLATRTEEGIHYIPHLATELLQWYMQEAKQIVCRSGYSSIMDLHTIGRKAHLIPTPGQTEQIYLAEIHK